MNRRPFSLITISLAFAVLSFGHACAQDGFFKDKVIRMIVGYSAGGGFDTYSRAISRHMGRHIPGSPNVVVENMPGAGSLIAANHLYKVAKPDGLTIANFTGGLVQGQLLGRPGIEFDALKFEYLGAPGKDTWVCALTKASGVTTIENWFASTTPVKVGGIAGDLVHDAPKILGAALGLPTQVVSGYKGTADIRLAAEAGEVAGGCWSWDSIKATWTRAIASGDAIVVVQIVSKAHPDLPKVPLAMNFARTDDARQLIEMGITIPAITNRPYVLPPNTPKDRVQILRNAFMNTMKDPEFLADATKSRLDLDPLGGEEMQKMVSGMFKLPAALVAKLREILK
jgi:tripartite-type tricarboxylate transporter receptor subunit TctC